MAASQQAYDYHDLHAGQIRVLHILPEAKTPGNPDNLTFELETISLNDGLDKPKQYDALSYAWGSTAELTYSLICEGRSIPIHRNLYLALPYLARRPTKLPIWIDVVCINQKKKEELNAQIKFQNHIYTKAIKVWIWLGPIAPDEVRATSQAVERISRMGATRINPEQLEGGTFTLYQLGLPNSTSQEWEAIVKILGSSWFTRLWIIQECTLAKKPVFLLGDFTVEWNHLWETNSRIYGPRKLIDEHGNGLGQAIDRSTSSSVVFYCRDQILNYGGDGFKHIAFLFPSTIQQRCGDPKSRIFGLLGFLEDRTVSSLALGETTEVPELYTEFFNYLICNSTYMRAILFVLWFAIDSAGRSNKNLPSWCPDFDALHQHGRGLDGFPNFRSSILSHKLFFRQRGRTRREIIFRGCVFDRVKNIGGKMADTWPMTMAEICKWWIKAKQWQDEGTSYSKKVMELKGYYHILFGYHIIGSVVRVTMDDYIRLKADLAELVTIARLSGLDRCVTYLEQPESARVGDERLLRMIEILTNLEEGNLGKELRRAIQSYSGYRPFISTKNMFGFIHGVNVTPGDRICLFNGAEAFYIIRNHNQNERNRDVYSLVGDAWIYDHMNGEVETWNLQEQNIVLI